MKRFLLGFLCIFCLATALADAAPVPTARTIILVRHGHYLPESGAGELGPGLSEFGRVQADRVGARLAALPTRIDALYVSPLRRARDTANEIAGAFPGRHFKVVDDLAECTPPGGQVEIMSARASNQAACKAQLERIFTKFFKPSLSRDRTDLFVCHSNVIRYLITRARGVDTRGWLDLSVGHSSVTTIRVEADGSFKVVDVGDVGHLPSDLRSGTSADPDRSGPIPALH